MKETGDSGDATYLRTLAIDEPLVRTNAVDGVQYLADALGSIVALTDPTGAAATTYTIEPFGRPAVEGIAINPIQYTGRENDGTGLYYYRARYYDPGRGRFVSQDPLGLVGGINSYVLLQNNPLRFRDPLGLYTIVGGIGGSAVAGKGIEASAGGYIDWSSGEAGGFVSVGGGAGLNVSGDIFGGVVWGELQGVTVNTNVVVGPLSVTVMVDPLTRKWVGGTLGVGPLIPGIPWGGLSETVSLTGKICLVNCPPAPQVVLGSRKQ